MASEKDLNSLATQLASTYLWRSKPSQVRTWSTRLKNVGWLQEFCTRMLKPSHTQTFTDALTSYLRDFRASRLVQQDNAGQTMTHATSGHTSRKELDSADLPLFSSKMLMELSAHDLEGMTGKTQKERPFCSMSLENWKDWVTEQRQDASQRQKRAHHTRGNDGSSWPTPQAMKGEEITGLENQDSLTKRMRFAGQPDPDNHSTTGNRQGFADWPTARTSDAEGGPIQTEMTDDGFRSYRSKSGQWFGAKLRDAAETHERNWPTPAARDPSGISGAGRQARKGNPLDTLPNAVILGNQDRKNWATPIQGDAHLASSPEAAQRRLAEGKVTLSRQTGGKLNPRWVETLMGLEIGWVSPEPCTPTTCTNRTDELRLLGNGVVPQTCAIAIKTLRERF